MQDRLAEIRAREDGPPDADCGLCSCCFDKPYLLELVDKMQVYIDTDRRQLKVVDDVLQWVGTGEGRVSSIEKLQQRVRELEDG